MCFNHLNDYNTKLTSKVIQSRDTRPTNSIFVSIPRICMKFAPLILLLNKPNHYTERT